MCFDTILIIIPNLLFYFKKRTPPVPKRKSESNSSTSSTHSSEAVNSSGFSKGENWQVTLENKMADYVGSMENKPKGPFVNMKSNIGDCAVVLTKKMTDSSGEIKNKMATCGENKMPGCPEQPMQNKMAEISMSMENKMSASSRGIQKKKAISVSVMENRKPVSSTFTQESEDVIGICAKCGMKLIEIIEIRGEIKYKINK